MFSTMVISVCVGVYNFLFPFEGAALGRLVGEIMHVIFNGYIKGSIEVGGYAVVGEYWIMLCRTEILHFIQQNGSVLLCMCVAPSYTHVAQYCV